MPLIMLTGPAGCGKTTMREKILRTNPETIVLSTDDFIQKYADQNGKTNAIRFGVEKLRQGYTVSIHPSYQKDTHNDSSSR